MKKQIFLAKEEIDGVEESSIPTQMNGDLSLYFHVPFCKKKCPYCHFYVIPDKNPFRSKLLKGFELEWKSCLPLIQKHIIKTIYFGGGTPSLLTSKEIQAQLNRIQKTHSIENLEITLEANPETPKPYKEYGINRLSFGVQSFDPCHLNILGREHSVPQSIKTIESAYNSGVQNISIDLMYDLPHQTLKTWEHTLKTAVNLPITHLSLYNLTIEPHTVFFKHQEKYTPHIPPLDLSLKMYQMAQNILSENGFIQYEISAFAKPQFASQHNLGYWSDRPFLGLGPSAFSYYQGKRYRNIANLNRYAQALLTNTSPIDFEEILSADEKIKEKLAIQLRILEGVDLKTFPKLPSATQDSVNFLISKNLLKLKGETLSLTSRGILLYDSIATEII